MSNFNSNQNSNQNRFKFTVKQNSTNATNSNNNNYYQTSTNRQPQQQQQQYQNSQSYNNYNQSQNQWVNQNKNQRQTTTSFNNQPQSNKVQEIIIDDKEDDDLLDISDTELIRASQVVESQLRFTNNVHHTTSNALNIFSQFNSNNCNQNNDCGGFNLMGPPASTTIYSNSNLNNDPYTQIEEMKTELKQVKSENMQKDGEVKILRDKLKRLEQETQKMRTEKVDLVKKLQQQQDEAKRNLQKQIEFKELENQFKSQEIVELTMKYKVLESTVRKNPNSTVILSSTPSLQTQQQHSNQHSMSPHNSLFDDMSHLNNSNTLKKTPQMQMPPPPQKYLPPSQQQIHQSKALPTKRSAQPINSSSNMSLSDNENDNPTLDIKRPLLSSNIANNSRQNINGSSSLNQIRAPLSPYSNNSSIIPPQPMNIKNESKTFQNTINTPPNPQTTITNQTNKISTKPETFIPKSTKQSLATSFKRTCVLNTKQTSSSFIRNETNSTNQSKENFLNSNEKIYKLTDQFAETANYLCKFNSMTKQTELNLNETINSSKNKISNLNIFNINRKLIELKEFIKENLITSKILFKQNQLVVQNSFVLVIERIEFVSNRLNNELVKLIEYCLKISTTSPNESSNKLNDIPNNLMFTSLENNLDTLNNSKQTILNSSKPANFKSFIDLLCLAFDICFNLFLFRANSLLISYQSESKSVKFEKSLTYDKLIKLKESFFLLISQLLESINFPSSASNSTQSKNNNNKTQTQQQSKSDSNKSTFSSYSTLKIFNSILDCFNYLLYLPNLNQLNEPYSLNTSFYTSLVDNMHTIFKPIKIIDLTVKEENRCTESDLRKELINTNDDEEDDEHCLFQLFYDKLIKYFGDIVYALEPNECSKSNEESNATNNTNHQQNQQMQIITTIAADENKNSKIDFKLENRIVEQQNLNTSISQNDNDILQSQADPNNTANNKNEQPSLNNITTNNCPLSNINQSSNNETKSLLTSNICFDHLNFNSIQTLKIEFITKFINYLHNYELYQSLECKLINRSILLSRIFVKNSAKNETNDNEAEDDKNLLNNCNKKRKIYESMTNLSKVPNQPIKMETTHEHSAATNNQKCSCFKDMLNTFLILIDYQFSEKFMFNGAKFNFENYFRKSSSSHSTFLFHNEIKNNLIDYAEDDNELNSFKIINALRNNSSMPILTEQNVQNLFKNEKLNEKENSNQFMYLLIVISFNVLMSLFNTDKYNKLNDNCSQFLKQKIDYLESIRDDYRVKNFFCLYKLAELNYEESSLNKSLCVSNDFHENEEEKMETNTNQTKTDKNDSDRIFDHLNSSFYSLKNLFKTYIDDYFDFS